MRFRSRSPLKRLVHVAVFAFALLATRASFADHYRVPTGSMEPTVLPGDRVVVLKAAYGLRVPTTTTYAVRYADPARGDVVVLEADEPVVLLKRVVAVAGDLVEVRGGRVSIDGRPVAERYATTDRGSGPDLGPVRVPRGKVLVLGDNRGNSRDGRVFGFVDRDRLLGRVVGVVRGDGSVGYMPL